MIPSKKSDETVAPPKKKNLTWISLKIIPFEKETKHLNFKPPFLRFKNVTIEWWFQIWFDVHPKT